MAVVALKPRRQYSFTDHAVANPAEPPPGDRLDGEVDRINATISQLIDWVSVSLNTDGTLKKPPSAAPQAVSAGVQTPPHAGGFLISGADPNALAMDWAEVSWQWAEHMPDTIPPNILATMGVTGDHWSSRWWANNAAQIVQNAVGSLTSVGDSPPSSPKVGDAWWNSAAGVGGGQLYIRYDDGSSIQWVPATNLLPGPAGPAGAAGAPGTPGSNANITGMVAGQIPIAATATGIASSANLSGDVSSNATLVTTLAAINANVGTFQGLTLDNKGRVTAAVNQGYLVAATAASTYAPLASPVFTGTPSLPTGTVAVTQTAGTSNAAVATTAFVATSFAPLLSPIFTGDPRAPTPPTADNDTSIATTAYVQAQGYATSATMATADGLRVLKAGDTMTGALGVGAAATGSTVLNVKSAADALAVALVAGVSRAVRIGTSTTGSAIEGVDNTSASFQPLSVGGSYTALASGGTERMRVDTTGNVGINNTAPGQLLAVGNGTTGSTGDQLAIIAPSGTARMLFVLGTGRVWSTGEATDGSWTVKDDSLANLRLRVDTGGACTNTSGTWAAISDRELKQDIAPYRRGLEAIVALNPVEFRYRARTPFATDEPSRVLYGLVADEVRPIVPEIVGKLNAEVDGKEREVDTLEPGNLIYALINSIKELKAEIDTLKAAGA